MYVAFVAPFFFLWAAKNGNFFYFRAEKNESELKQKAHEPSRAELKKLQLELWLEPARLGLITSKLAYRLLIKFNLMLIPNVKNERKKLDFIFDGKVH